jgi:peptidoglycan/xylan/chitin deacetylase (PgdA/CDA1 family)
MRFGSFFAGLAVFAGIVAAQDVSDATSALEKRAQAKVYTKCTGNKQVAITFDDGPYAFDEQLRTALAKYKAKATFFVNVRNWGCSYDDDRIKFMRDLYKDGHEFGSHTATHKNMSTLTWNQMHSEMWGAEEMLIRVLGVNPAMFRPPYGAYTPSVLSAVAARNQSVIMWDFDSEDTLGRTPASTKAMYKSLVDKKVKNALALNHSIKEPTVKEVIPYALDILSKAGYTFVPVSKCLGIKPYQWTQKQGTKNAATWKCPPAPAVPAAGAAVGDSTPAAAPAAVTTPTSTMKTPAA